MVIDKSKEKTLYYLTGSQQFNLMKDVSESLAGRVGILNLLGLRLREIKNILVLNGWSIKTAVCFIILMMFHYPCSTTLLTIKKELKNNFYTILAFLIPTLVGIILCLIVNIMFS